MLELTIKTGAKEIKLLTPTQFYRVAQRVGDEVRKAVVDATPVDTGKAKAGWEAVRRNRGGISFGNREVYTASLIEGSIPGSRPWPSVGPKTTASQGRIYSSQAPGGILEKAKVDEIVEKISAKVIEDVLNEAR